MPAPLGYDQNRRCNDVLSRWREFTEEMQAASDATRAIWRKGMELGYPSAPLTMKFVKWLLSTRMRESHATRREGRPQAPQPTAPAYSYQPTPGNQSSVPKPCCARRAPPQGVMVIQ